MQVSEGSRLGPYEIVSSIGSGGMGVVYRARDTRLGRDVALKVLPPTLSADDSLRRRFVREARAISSLNHPHICALHDIGSENGRDFLVMELLEGETLAQRLARGPLPLDQALAYGRQIAAALEAAHAKGIVHRDLKPGNIIVTAAGAKLLDFGLARLHDAETESSAAPLTSVDALVGTIDYMAPEQLNSSAVDERTDIFAFGIVLYEMVAGVRPFRGQNRASVMGAILFQDVEPLSHASGVTPVIDRVIASCLEKKPEDRIQTAHDLRLQLELVAEGVYPERRRGMRLWRRRSIPFLWAAALALSGAVAGVGIARWRTPQVPAQQEVRFPVLPPANGLDIDYAVLSPNGRRLVLLTKSVDGKSELWLRDLHDPRPRRLAGTEFATQPFWSPDSESIGFFAHQKLRVLHLAASVARELADIRSPRGASWGPNGQILFTPQIASGIYSVPVLGGAMSLVTQLEKRDGSHRWPEFLPDGERFLFVVQSRHAARRGLYLGSLRSKELRRVAAVTSRVVVLETGWLLFVEAGQLYAQRFDIRDAAIRGQPVAIASGVGVDLQVTGATAFSAARTGAVVYVTRPPQLTQLTWYDRTGRRLGVVGSPGNYVNPALSPDGRRVAVSRIDAYTGTHSLWLVDVATDAVSRLTADDNNADNPVWSADGSTIYFSSDRRGRYEVYARDLRTGSERLAFPSEQYVLFAAVRKTARLVHVALPSSGGFFAVWPNGGTPRRLMVGNSEGQSDLSPDAQWIAFTRRDAAIAERGVFVQSVNDSTIRHQVSQGESTQPTWSSDGREIFYVREDRTLFSARFASGRFSEPQPLFRIDVGDLYYGTRDYVMSPDDQRILVNERVHSGEKPTATVVLGALPQR